MAFEVQFMTIATREILLVLVVVPRPRRCGPSGLEDERRRKRALLKNSADVHPRISCTSLTRARGPKIGATRRARDIRELFNSLLGNHSSSTIRLPSSTWKSSSFSSSFLVLEEATHLGSMTRMSTKDEKDKMAPENLS